MGKMKKTKTAADFGYEVQLCQMADAIRGTMGVSSRKHFPPFSLLRY